MRGRFIKLITALSLGGLVAFGACVNPRQGYAPEQPIKFSHQLHAGVNQIACRYCHVSVGEGPHGSVPSVNTCMNCHSLVKTQSPEIQKIKAAWDSGTPIEWVKVHDLPDHARFSHQPHVTAGIDCTECHGQVNTMEVVEVVKPFNMGWCVNCHRQPENNAPVDCVTCHY